MDTQPWDRQPGEGVRPYDRFLVYRDMGPTRSLTRAVKLTRIPSKGFGRVIATQGGLGYWRKLCQKWRWQPRAEAWDMHIADCASQASFDTHLSVRVKEINENAEERYLRLREARAARKVGRSVLSRFLDLVEGKEIEKLPLAKTKVETTITAENGTVTKNSVETKGILDLIGLAIQAVIEGQRLESIELGEAEDELGSRDLANIPSEKLEMARNRLKELLGDDEN